MVNPGAFLGTRKAFLAEQMDLYAAAVTENHIADTVADIQRRYFKRYPISLPHHKEPSAEWLAQVDDGAPDEDLLTPDSALLDNNAFKVAQATYNEHVKLLKFRKEQISRRLAYQHTKVQNPVKHIEVGSEDPMVVLMAKLTGIPLKKPRLRAAYNVWGQHNRQFVDPIYKEQEKDVLPSKRAALRMRIYKDCFGELDEDEQRDYEKLAIEERDAAVAKVEEALNAPPSQDPEVRQQILRSLPKFIQPVLDLITAHAGWKATLLIGGPEPADQGRLNVMSFHSGETSGAVKMNFGRSERRAYKDFVVPVFGNFLKKCYTIEECRAASLSDPTAVSLAEALHLDGGEFDVDSAEEALTYVKVARTPGSRKDPNNPTTPASPSTYEVPAKIGPPIHLKKRHDQRSPAAVTPSSNVLLNLETPLRVTSAIGDNCPTSQRLSPCRSAAPSPVPSLRASPVSPARAVSAPATHASPACASPTRASSVHASPVRALPTTIDTSTLPAHASQSSTPPIPLAPPSMPDPTQDTVVEMPALPHAASSLMVLGHPKRRHRDEGVDEQSVHSEPSINDPRKRLRSSKAGASTHNMASELHVIQPTAPLTPAEMSSAPDWFLKAYQMLISTDLGPGWQQLVRAWAHFEMASSYKEQGNLGTDGRPACVGAWISRARQPKYRPNLGSLLLFEKAFNHWWVGLQPKWRTEDTPTSVLRRQAGNLECLRRPGKNGLLSVLAALFFWGISMQRGMGVERRRHWSLAIDDVNWVIGRLTSA